MAKLTAENKEKNVIMKQLLKGVNDVIIELGITDRLLGEHNFSEVGSVTETLCLFFKNNRL